MAAVRFNPIVIPEPPEIPRPIRRADRIPEEPKVIFLPASEATSLAAVQAAAEVMFHGFRSSLVVELVNAFNHGDIGGAVDARERLELFDLYRQWFFWEISLRAFGQKKRRQRGRFRAGSAPENDPGMRMKIRIPHS